MAKTSINAKLGLDTTAFQRGMAKSQKSVSNFVKNGIRQFGALAGAAGLGAMASSALRLAADINNLSKVANTSAEDFQKFAFAARTVGVEQEKLADVLKDVSDKVGDFLQTGGGPMKDFFENIAPKVGVTADQFRNLSGKDALQLYVSSLEKANVSQNEMTFFMEAIASDATLLLPLLRNNAQALTELGNEAMRLGLVMDDDVVNKLNNASIEINKFKVLATILTGIFLTKAVPAFSLFGQGLGVVSDMVAMLTGKFLSFLGFLSRSVSATLKPIIKQFESLSIGIKGVMLGLKREFGEADKAFKNAAKLQKQSWEALKDIPSQLAKEAKRANREMEIDSKAFEESANRRREKAKQSWADMWGDNVKTAKDSMGKINSATGATGGGVAGAGGGGGTASAKASGAGGAMGIDIERGEYESRNDFPRRRERARAAHLLLNEKLRQQASTGESAGITDELITAAKGGGASNKNSTIEKATVESAENLKAIKNELTRTT